MLWEVDSEFRYQFFQFLQLGLRRIDLGIRAPPDDSQQSSRQAGYGGAGIYKALGDVPRELGFVLTEGVNNGVPDVCGLQAK